MMHVDRYSELPLPLLLQTSALALSARTQPIPAKMRVSARQADFDAKGMCLQPVLLCQGLAR